MKPPAIVLAIARVSAIALFLQPGSAPSASAEEKEGPPSTPPRVESSKADQEVLRLSRQKWAWMSERNTASLEALFHTEAVFVHIGGTMSRQQELDVIKSGRIHYKDVDIQEASIRVIGNTAIVLNRISLVAVVGGNEVTNPFVVTEVYVQQGEAWKLASLSFTRLNR